MMRQMYVPEAPPKKIERGGIKGFFLNCYYDPARWTFIKSVAVAGFGLYMSKEMKGIDFFPPA